MLMVIHTHADATEEQEDKLMTVVSGVAAGASQNNELDLDILSVESVWEYWESLVRFLRLVCPTCDELSKNAKKRSGRSSHVRSCLSCHLHSSNRLLRTINGEPLN